MPLPNELDRDAWTAVVGEVDWRLTSAIERVVGSRPNPQTIDAIAEGFHELQTGLRDRGVSDPDYKKLGVAIAYTFKFMPQRVSSVAAALALLAQDRQQLPKHVLDIGSGTDATRLAFDLSITVPLFKVRCTWRWHARWGTGAVVRMN